MEHVVSIKGEGGYLTNAYLDPVIPVWERSARASFLGVTPAVQLTWTRPKDQFMLGGQGRYTLMEGDNESWWLASGMAQYQYDVSNSLKAGLGAGGSSLRVVTSQVHGWAAPYVQWVPSPAIRLGLRGGVSARSVAATDSLDAWSQSSYFGLLESLVWPGGAWFSGLTLYTSRTPDSGTAGLGVSVTGGYRVTNRLQFTSDAGLDRLSYGGLTSETDRVQDLTLRVSGSVEWALSNNLALTATLGVQQYRSDYLDDPLNDVYVSTGLNFVLRGGRTTSGIAARPLWSQDGDRVSFSIPYEGQGEVYLVGDFNAWKEHDITLHRIREGVYGATVSIPPGVYQFRIQAVEGGQARWVSLPDNALTVDDGFGETNGVLQVVDEEKEGESS